MGLIDETGEPIIDPERGKKTVQQGASTIVFAATSPLSADLGGLYLSEQLVKPRFARDSLRPSRRMTIALVRARARCSSTREGWWRDQCPPTPRPSVT